MQEITNQTPLVSIIIPVYNVQNYLEQCLESITNQTLPDIEIICINDGSTDKSSNILNEYAKKDKRIIIYNKSNEGLSAARNDGIKLARGEYIGFVDSDDWVDKDFFEKLYTAASKYNADIAAASIIRKRKHHQKYRIHYTKEKLYTQVQDKIDICNIPNMSYVWNKIYKRESFLKNNLNFKFGVYYEDIIFSIEAVYKLDKVVTVPGTYYWYRANRHSIVKSKAFEKKDKDSYNAKIQMLDFAQKHNIKINKKHKRITIKKYSLGFFTLLKIKEIYKANKCIYYLFGFIPFKIAPLN